MTTLAQAMARRRRRKPPPPIRGLIPGYGQQIEQRRQRSQHQFLSPRLGQRNPLGDREGIPPRTRYTYPRGRTWPNPNSVNSRRPRSWN